MKNPLSEWRSTTKHLRLIMAAVLLLQALLPLIQVQVAQASTVGSAVFTGGANTFTAAGGTVYAKNGGALTLTVSTSNDTKCVEVSGAFTAKQTSNSAKSTWTFSFTAGTGEGTQAVMATASPDFNSNNCTGQSKNPQSASFVLDNTGPVVTGTISPTPNAAGWNNSNVTITWSATDAGSGVASGPTPATDSQTAPGSSVLKTATAKDNLNNSGSGLVTVNLDKNAPTISGSRSPAANANGWNNTDVVVSFTCSDSPSGIKSCTPSTTVSLSAANQSVTGTAVDNADNSASTTVGGINIDKVAPTLSGAPTSAPNAAGWYNGNVTIQWTAADGLSGLASAVPANSTISSEGMGLTANASVSDKAGNTVNATSSPAVKIDKTAPNTTATAPANWNNTNVNVSLTGFDALSGVTATYYVLDGGAQQAGADVAIGAEGIHTLQFWSVDNAGNSESAKSVQVKIDKTPPTINHTQAPVANSNGWNNSDVTVTFICGDSLSGLASCTAAQTVTTEGQNQSVTGTALDNAGNSATDPATVSIDKTAPVVTAAPDRAPNSAGWYNNDVTVSFACSDALSGIDVCPTPQILGEGASQSASGNATDAAGNSGSAGVSGINVDKTAPSLSGAVTTAQSGPGWYNTDVTVVWTCGDTLSGAGPCPGNNTLTGEGAGQSASASVGDLAGNTANATVSGINIDKTAPSTSASVPDPLDTGWYAGSVLVTLQPTDGLSGIMETQYSVDGHPGVVYGGPFEVTGGGVHTVVFFSKDNAGNSEDYYAPGHSITLKIDGLPPTITGSRSPAANAKSWNNAPVTVSFDCDDQESGIATCTDAVTLSAEGQDQSVAGQALDKAGNTAGTTVTGINIDLTPPSTSDNAPTGWHNANVTVNLTAVDNLSGVDYTEYLLDSGALQTSSSVAVADEGIHSLQYRSVDNAGNVEAVKSAPSIQIDKTLPTIIGAADRPANGNGWYKANVTVSFACNDALSGIESCSPAAELGEGNNQSATGTAADKAGNTAGTTVGPINVDKTLPTLSGAPTTSPNPAGWYNSNVTIAWSASDALSGLVGTSPPDTVLSDEGTNKTASATVKDLAGNETSASSAPGVNIDKTNPTISGAADRAANGAGWYKADVTVSFTCDDSLSGVAWCTPDAVLAEGSSQSAPGTVLDKAGNAASAAVGPINVDKTAPAISHSQAPAANVNGWNKTDVTVTFTCADALSGVDACTSPETVTTEGKDQAVAGTAVDIAGNSAADQANVNIDKTKPTITGTPDRAANGNNWYKDDVMVSFSCDDTLSGINTCEGPKTLVEGVDQSASGAAIDKAGNEASATVANINVDKTNPTISGAANRAANAAGWYNADVTVSFTCDDSLSGVVWCSPDAVVGQGQNQSTTGTVLDKAGNGSSATVSGINVDKTAPSITASKSPASNAAGWNKTDVTVTFTCADDLSGIDACTSPQTIGEGNNQSASGMAVDKAGNSAGATVSPIKVDKTAPTITWNGGPADGGAYYFGSVPAAPTCTAIDALSGPNGCTVSGYSTAIGSATMTATGYDVAGNQTTAQRSYTVKGWTASGFFQPVDMASSAANLVWNTVKNGSTVPLKFRIFAGVTELKDVAAVKSLTSAQVVCTAGTEDAVEEVATTTGGTVLRYDTTGGQFVYNWATPKKAGNCYRVTMTGQDNSTIIAYFKLK